MVSSRFGDFSEASKQYIINSALALGLKDWLQEWLQEWFTSCGGAEQAFGQCLSHDERTREKLIQKLNNLTLYS
jgi:hypothetical protein